MSKNWYSDLPQYYQRQIRAMGLDEAGLSRRRMLKGMGAAAGLAAIGLGSSRQAKAATQMTYMCWEGYNDARIIDPFNKANDSEIAFDLIVDSPGGFAKLQAGASREVDIVSSDMAVDHAHGTGGTGARSQSGRLQGHLRHLLRPVQTALRAARERGQDLWRRHALGLVGPCINTDVTKPEAWKTYDPVFDSAQQGQDLRDGLG